jgi:hypothetical protein
MLKKIRILFLITLVLLFNTYKTQNSPTIKLTYVDLDIITPITVSCNNADVVVKVVESGTNVDLNEGSNPKPNEQFKNVQENAKETQEEIDKNKK